MGKRAKTQAFACLTGKVLVYQRRSVRAGPDPANIGESMAPRSRRTSSATPRSDAVADSPKTPLTEAVLRQRLLSGISQEEAAKRAGVSASAWRKIENGEVPRPRQLTLVRMARGLRADPNVFLGPAGLPLVESEPARFPRTGNDTEFRLCEVEKVVSQLAERQSHAEGELSEIKEEIGQVKQLMSELVAAGVATGAAPSGSPGGQPARGPGGEPSRRPRAR